MTQIFLPSNLVEKLMFFHYSWIWFKMETIMIVIHVLFLLLSVSFWSIIFCVYMCNIHFIKYLFFILFCYLFETTKKQLCFPLTILSYVPYSFTSFFYFLPFSYPVKIKFLSNVFKNVFRKTLHCFFEIVITMECFVLMKRNMPNSVGACYLSQIQNIKK